MNRRSLLVGAGIALTVPTAGCFGSRSTEPEDDDPENDTVDGTPVYDISLDVTDRDPADEFDVELGIDVRTDTVTETSPAEIRVSLENNEPGSITVGSGPGWPFGVLTLTRESDADETVRVPFRSDRYEASEHIADAENVTATDGLAVSEAVGGGESVAAVYELHSDAHRLEPGPHELTVSNSLEDGTRTDGHSLTATVEITAAD